MISKGSMVRFKAKTKQDPVGNTARFYPGVYLVISEPYDFAPGTYRPHLATHEPVGPGGPTTRTVIDVLVTDGPWGVEERSADVAIVEKVQ